MSERYSKLFALSENLYCAGAPVVIVAGALQKDNQTGKVFVQLKIRNIQSKTIKAATVKVTPFDTVGKPLGGTVDYQYLDLSAGRETDFGQKSPVILPNVGTRSFSVSVVEVVYSDNSVWTASNGIWKPLSATGEGSEIYDELITSQVAKVNKEKEQSAEKSKKVAVIVSGAILAIIGAVMFINGFMPNLQADGPTIRVLLIGAWTGLLAAAGVLLAVAGVQNKKRPLTIPAFVGGLAIICFIAFFALTYF